MYTCIYKTDNRIVYVRRSWDFFLEVQAHLKVVVKAQDAKRNGLKKNARACVCIYALYETMNLVKKTEGHLIIYFSLQEADDDIKHLPF